MKRKCNVYTVNVSDDYYIFNPQSQAYEWAEDFPELRRKGDDGKYTREKPKVFPTWGKALGYAQWKADSGWDCVTIYDVCCGEVWENVSSYKKCKCCKHEVIDGIHNDTHHETPEHDWQLPEKN